MARCRVYAVQFDRNFDGYETLRYKRDPQNPLNGDAPVIADLSGHH
jgi:hypothetical protein